jgi:hypothetical protein
MRFALSLGLAVLLGGCGGGPKDQPDLGTVSGQVTLDGKPVAGAVVTFQPKESGRPSTAETDLQGNYQLIYSSREMGAKVGLHSVRVTTEVPVSYDDAGKVIPGSGKPEIIPDRYNANSELEHEVKPGPNEINLELKK